MSIQRNNESAKQLKDYNQFAAVSVGMGGHF